MAEYIALGISPVAPLPLAVEVSLRARLTDHQSVFGVGLDPERDPFTALIGRS